MNQMKQLIQKVKTKLTNKNFPCEEADIERPATQRSKSAFGSYLITVLICTLLLGASIAGIFEYNRKETQEAFTVMTTENLNAYIAGQKADTLAKIDEITGRLEAMAVLIGQRSEEDFIDTYLLALNENRTDTTYTYNAAEEFDEKKSRGNVRDIDETYLEQLERGENVVSDVIFSRRRGNIYCIAIGVPVMKNGEFTGVIRAVTKADGLVSTSFYPPAQGQIAASFLTYGDGTIVPVDQESADYPEQNLIDRLIRDQVDEEIIEKLEWAYDQENVIESILTGTFDGVPIYLSMTDLGYNDWHLVVCLKADMAAVRTRQLVVSTVIGTAAYILMLAFVFVILMLFLWKLQKKMTLEEKRYLLLEQFSDTVLFDYDRRSDTMRFTDNATKLMKLPALVIQPFIKSSMNSYVWEEDVEIIKKVLSGRAEEGVRQERIRLAHAGDGRLFWCQLRFRYIYSRGEVISVIGRISDIDEQKQREEYLQTKSETDGLTGFLNRQAVEIRINDCIAQNPNGTLFMMDMDRFKEINDTYGHVTGDHALKFMAACIRKTFRSEDIFGRAGGDEIVVYVDGVSDSRITEKKIRTLQMYLAEGENEGLPLLSVSVGTATAPENGTAFKDLFLQADRMMYLEKQKKKIAGR